MVDFIFMGTQTNDNNSQARSPSKFALPTIRAADRPVLLSPGIRLFNCRTQTGLGSVNIPQTSTKRFAIAVSFPSEHQDFVRNVANRLVKELGRERVFYYPWYVPELTGVDGDLKLRRIYEDSEIVVPFFSKHYREKKWCGLEWSKIRAILQDRRDEDVVIPVDMDGTRIDG